MLNIIFLTSSKTNDKPLNFQALKKIEHIVENWCNRQPFRGLDLYIYRLMNFSLTKQDFSVILNEEVAWKQVTYKESNKIGMTSTYPWKGNSPRAPT